GDKHSIILTEKGNAYSFGDNKYGQLGLKFIGDEIFLSVNKPTLIGPFPEEKFISVACKADHSILITDRGNAYSFGRNNEGQLGIGNFIDQYKPALIKPIENEKFVLAACGGASDINQGFSILLTNKGRAYSCGGADRFGNLGLGDCENRNIPT